MRPHGLFSLSSYFPFPSLQINSTSTLQLLRRYNCYSSSISKKTKWNSQTNVIITNPILLLLESCSTMSQLHQIQAFMTKTSLITHTFPLSRLLAFCALSDTGDLNYAFQIFSQIEKPNTYMWNTMIRGCCNARTPSSGLFYFNRMIRECVEMDSRSFVFALKACGQLDGFLAGKSVHCRVLKIGCDVDLLFRNGLVCFYARFGYLYFARQVFDESPVRDVVSWTSMIDGYAAGGFPNEALELFDSMVLSGVKPNEVTMITVLSASSLKGDLLLGKNVHEYMRRENINMSVNLFNALIYMYVKCGCLSSAREVFDNMENRDVYSWTIMINGFAKCDELDVARMLFDKMPDRTTVSWNAMIAGYTQNNRPKEALELFQEMVEAGFNPVENTLACVLSACGQLGCLAMGRWIHDRYILSNHIQLSVILGNVFVDMYAKCGCMDAAVKTFNEMPERTLVSWNSIITGVALHGRGSEALLLFDQLRSTSLKPDDITFIGVLSACSHAGLVAEGREYFKSMKRDFGVVPKVEHFACMVDLYGRMGLLDEAFELVKTMPMGPSEAVWGSLLNACRMYGNIELAMLAADRLLELDPGDSGIYTLLASVYAKGKRWNNVRMVRSMMRERSVKKNPGHSLIEVDGVFHEFLAADESHFQSNEIYSVLNDLTLLSRLQDYVYTSQLISLDMCLDNFS